MSKFILSAFADEAAEDLKTQMDIMELNGISFIEMRNVNGKSIVRHTLDEVEEIKKSLTKGLQDIGGRFPHRKNQNNRRLRTSP